MNRKDFLTKLAVTTVVLNGISITDVLASPGERPELFPPLADEDLAPVSDEVNKQFKELLRWMDRKGWTQYLATATNADTAPVADAPSGNKDHSRFIQVISNLSLKTEGFDDFAGKRLIEPGSPALSLLYHALASPRVQPENFENDQFPSTEQLDALENYIYALKKTDIPVQDLKNNYVLAVFAYEYRPAYKTPHHLHADMVFSRTGVARIGEREMQYDRRHRCYTNRPGEKDDKKNIAVTPARYGVFLSKITKKDGLSLMGTEKNDPNRYFLQPVRKLFNHDLLIDNKALIFDEYHKAEKLHRLAVDNRIKLPPDLFDIDKAPFVRVSPVDHIVDLTARGSSVLLSSVPEKLVRQAWQEAKYLLPAGAVKDERLRYEVPKGTDVNRYYSSFSLLASLEEADIYILYGPEKEGLALTNKNRKTRPFKDTGPKNSPLFVNMRYVDEAKDGRFEQHLGPNTPDFENVILNTHWAGLFEDSICDGCISATVDLKGYTGRLPIDMLNSCLPAFSLVTAPDFFPQVDSFDLLKYDISSTQDIESNFVEGGTASLCTLRKRPNRHTRMPKSECIAFPPVQVINRNDKRSMVHDTVTAVVAGKPAVSAGIRNKFTDPKQKNYVSLSFLPDAASSVFAPGWDVSYSNDSKNVNDIYLSTRGLGSPFPEDMKLCAAANGMWPAASPDLARAFAGSTATQDLESGRYIVNPTAVPLMDLEIGVHPDSPAYRGPGALSGSYTGWDGEQGPFLKKATDGKVLVDFTDISRSDFVKNAQEGVYDMSLLRDLSSAELISRMECLRICIKQLDAKTIVAGTTLWLVSAEKVDWDKGAAGHGIIPELFDNSKEWATRAKDKINGNGYLYVFVNAKRDSKGKERWVDPRGKRRIQECSTMYVCQVTENAIAWCEVIRSKAQSAAQLKWTVKEKP